jgi:hypothetical protein
MPLVDVTRSVAADPISGWAAFGDLSFVLHMTAVLMFAMALGMLIAYHPVTRRKATSLERLDQPKTFVTYAMVGAVVAQIVNVRPEMALVVFGIGGLLRFRTDVGEAKDTGRVILVTVAGLCTGLELYVVAVLTTVLGWLAILLLDRSIAGRLLVEGLDPKVIPDSARAYVAALADSGCVVVGEQKNAAKGRLALVFKAQKVPDDATFRALQERVPPELRGIVDWELS